MPNTSAYFYRFRFIVTALILGIPLASPPAFAGLFPLERIDCGTVNVKVQTVTDLQGQKLVVALATEKKTIVIGRASSPSSSNLFFILSEICNGLVKNFSQQSPASTNAAASNGLDTFTVGDRPTDVTGGDFNGDGHIDLAVANLESDNVSILLNNAGTGFLEPTNVPTGSDDPRALVSGDFNSDGRVDLATANLGDGMGDVSLLLGDGNGGFAAPITVTVSAYSSSFTAAAFGSSPVSLATADFNKDGNLDLAIADSGGNALVRLGNGNGTFQAPTALNAPGQFSILTEDLNGDGALDVITNSFVLLNDGTGNFPTATNFAPDFQPILVRAGDLNGDGILDLVTANESSNSVMTFIGHGDGSFQTPLHYIVGDKPGEIIVGDLDGNGTVDLAVSNLGSDHLSILLGTGNGEFLGGQSFPSTFSANQTTNRVALTDFDGDGLLDLAAANLLGNGNATVLKGQAFGKFSTPFDLTDQQGGEVVAGDFNGDTKPDLAFIQKGSPRVKNDTIEVRLGNGNLTFDSSTTLSLLDADYALNFTLAVDVDGNGTLDLVTANTGTDDVSVFLGNGDGTFQGALTTAVGDQPTWVAAGHLDGNATLDLAVVNAGPLGGQAGTLSVLFGTGNGGFSPGPKFFLNTEPNSVIIGDLNGDGKSDLAAIVQSPHVAWNLQVVLGNGNGTFRTPTVIPLIEDLVGNLTASDLDLDGDLDLIMTVGTEIGILANHGDGTFQPLLRFDGGTPMGPITAIDLNHDQRPDLVIPQSRGGTTTVLLNTAAAPTRISHDINGDGTADLVWRDTNSGTVAIWFMKGATIKSTAFPAGVSLDWKIQQMGDLNRDGKADLVWQNTSNGLVAVWLMNGQTITSVGSLATVPLAWQIAGMGDMDDNGTADLVWRNTSSGTTAVWLMNGATIQSMGFPASVSLDWQIAKVGDVNADGKTDIIWHNSNSGVVAVWLMNGLTISSVAFPGSNPTTWVIEGAGDLNGNGTTDIVWRNTGTGEVALWLLNGTTITSSGIPGEISLDWQMRQVGDVNADGKADVIWHNSTTGAVSVWLMNGLSIASVEFPGTVPTDWEIQ